MLNFYSGDKSFESFLTEHNIPATVGEIRAILIASLWSPVPQELDDIIDEILYAGTDEEHQFESDDVYETFRKNLEALQNTYQSYLGSSSRIPGLLKTPELITREEKLRFLGRKISEAEQLFHSMELYGTLDVVSRCPQLMICFDHIEHYQEILLSTLLCDEAIDDEQLDATIKFIDNFNTNIWPQVYSLVTDILKQIYSGERELLTTFKAKKEYEILRKQIEGELKG